MPDGRVSSAKLIAGYYRKNGTLPKVAAALSSEEAQLYRALARIRLLKRKGKLEQAASRTLDRACPGWADGFGFHSDRLWQKRRDELIAWIKANGRPPHYASGDSTERALAGWVATYRKHVRHGRHPERIKELDMKVPGWSQPPVWAPKT